MPSGPVALFSFSVWISATSDILMFKFAKLESVLFSKLGDETFLSSMDETEQKKKSFSAFTVFELESAKLLYYMDRKGGMLNSFSYPWISHLLTKKFYLPNQYLGFLVHFRYY